MATQADVKTETPLDLAERCAAAKGPDRELDASINRYLASTGTFSCWGCDDPLQFTASLDAALTLLPDGWIVATLEWWPMKHHAAARLRAVKDFEAEGSWGFGYDETCAEARSADIMATPALAICAAALRAQTLSGGDQ